MNEEAVIKNINMNTKLIMHIAHNDPNTITFNTGNSLAFANIPLSELIPPNTTNDNAVNIATNEINCLFRSFDIGFVASSTDSDASF